MASRESVARDDPPAAPCVARTSTAVVACKRSLWHGLCATGDDRFDPNFPVRLASALATLQSPRIRSPAGCPMQDPVIASLNRTSRR